MKLIVQNYSRFTAHISPKKTEEKGEKENTEKMTPLALQNRQFIEMYKKTQENSAGGKLSGLMDHITLGRKADPAGKGNASSVMDYQKALFMKEERDHYKKMLRQCRSKEEVRKLRTQKMNEFLAEIHAVERSGMEKGVKESALEYIRQRIEGISEEHKKFTEEAEYQRLPEKVKEDEKERLMREILEQRSTKKAEINLPKKKDVVAEAKADIAARRERGEFEMLAAMSDTQNAEETAEVQNDTAPAEQTGETVSAGGEAKAVSVSGTTASEETSFDLKV